jgi:hypothetical protein
LVTVHILVSIEEGSQTSLGHWDHVFRNDLLLFFLTHFSSLTISGKHFCAELNYIFRGSLDYNSDELASFVRSNDLYLSLPYRAERNAALMFTFSLLGDQEILDRVVI